MRFELRALPTDGDFIEVFATLELQNGDRTRWTCGGLSRVSPPVVGVWMPVGLDEQSSAPEHLLELTSVEAISLANELYAAAGLAESPTAEPEDVVTPETWDARDIRDFDENDERRHEELMTFFGSYDKISLERHPR